MDETIGQKSLKLCHKTYRSLSHKKANGNLRRVHKENSMYLPPTFRRSTRRDFVICPERCKTTNLLSVKIIFVMGRHAKKKREEAQATMEKKGRKNWRTKRRTRIDEYSRRSTQMGEYLKKENRKTKEGRWAKQEMCQSTTPGDVHRTLAEKRKPGSIVMSLSYVKTRHSDIFQFGSIAVKLILGQGSLRMLQQDRNVVKLPVCEDVMLLHHKYDGNVVRQWCRMTSGDCASNTAATLYYIEKWALQTSQ